MKEIKKIKEELKGKGIRELKEIIIEYKLRNIGIKEIEKVRKNRRFKKISILERDGFKCILCGDKEDLNIHHLIPKIIGGTSKNENLITLCHYCHWYLHSNPKTSINKSNLVKKAYIKKKLNGDNNWGRPSLSIEKLNECSKYLKEGKSYREVNKLCNVSIGKINQINKMDKTF